MEKRRCVSLKGHRLLRVCVCVCVTVDEGEGESECVRMSFCRNILETYC